ncbi:MAG: hypothetical protein PVS3B1_38500 [Ktedonobacteraceae bacterium]
MIETKTLYTDGTYLEENPLWHADESPWKVSGVVRMLRQHNIHPQTICEVGCGVGEVLRLLQEELPAECEFWGYDIAPQAIERCQPKQNGQLHFILGDVLTEYNGRHFDVILMLDVLEHLEDYFSFLRNLRTRSDYKIIQLPMDISLRSILFKHLPEFRRTYGHLHYFTKETALRMVHDAGYEIIAYTYNGPPSMTPFDWNLVRRQPWLLPKKLLGWARRFAPRKAYDLLFILNPDFAVRLTGRQRLLILAR